MRLKRLTLHGFKTFADKTEITFVPGVTAIVGPNGSGKSNLLDALTWCLGEQKASSVRAARAQDVIFAGSDKRRAMGMAEVSLTVDNEDRFLPLDFAEVTVTRRIYRSGEAEYLLNKAPCRLKDITDLFLDTGVGRGAYAIVNQSEIDGILSGRPEERRELFEEAAGIKKYRVRKREAQRKLDHTEQNLVRVRDILSEIGIGLEPLEAQANAAKRWLELTGRLREVEVGQLAADYKRLSDELSELTTAADRAAAEADRARTEAAVLEASGGDLSRRIAEAEAGIETARQDRQSAASEAERIESRIALGGERRESALRTIATLERDLAALVAEKERLEAEAVQQTDAAREAEARVTDLARDLAHAEAVVQEADRALTELTRAVRGQEAGYLELARRLAAQKAELESLRARITQRAGEIAEAEERARRRGEEAGTARAESETFAADWEAAKAAHAEARRVLSEEREPERLRVSEQMTAILERRASGERRLAETGGRLRALEETEAAQEGYYAGVRAVTRAVQNGRLNGRYQPVADAIRVPEGLDTAIEIALGGSLQDIITDTEAEAKAAIRHLNETRGGRATFLPLDSLRNVEVPDALRRASRQFSGVRGPAADLVGHDADVAPAVRVLLARVLIVDDLDTATRVSRQLARDWSKIVTLTGEVVVPSGAITGGSQGRPGPNLLGRKREIAELGETVARLRASLAALGEEEITARAAQEAARQAVREAEMSITTARDAAADTERRYRARAADAERLAKEADSLAARVTSLRESLITDQAREAALAQALSLSDQQDEGAVATREEMQTRLAALSVRKGEAQSTARSLSVELASLRERVRSLTRDSDRARDIARRSEQNAAERRLRAAEAQAVIEREEADAVVHRDALAHARAAESDAAAQWEALRAGRQALQEENAHLNERIRGLLREAQQSSEQAQSSRLRAARIEVQAEAVGQRLLNEYELHPDSAVALTGGVPVERDVAQEIARLRREIRALGAVNTGAIEEFERQSERWRFLSEQKTDLEEARERLSKAIAEIDESTRGVFLETFRQVGAAFSRLFGRLFGGGTAELVLTDPNDVLETGIEILAQPPGKRRQNLALLSGGERALTATALLFAFLEVRPAPFCVLDEVDAPLDGANVEKFADLLRDFGAERQFIVITHNATTMEAAPLWFGVTMAEPGISRTLSMRVPEAEASITNGTASSLNGHSTDADSLNTGGEALAIVAA